MLSDCQNLNRLTGYRARRERSWRDFVHAQRAAWSLRQGLKLEARVVLSADAGLLVITANMQPEEIEKEVQLRLTRTR